MTVLQLPPPPRRRAARCAACPTAPEHWGSGRVPLACILCRLMALSWRDRARVVEAAERMAGAGTAK